MKKFRNEKEYEDKKQQLSDLIELKSEDYIDIYFADESNFNLTPNVPYAWQHKETPILLPSKRSANINVFGLLNTDCDFKYYSTTNSINSDTVISFIDQFSTTINKKTIIVLDNAPIHRSNLFKDKIKKWTEQDLFIFFLPAYSPELNKMEIL